MAYYDKNKNLISTDIVSALPQYQTITTPSNCYYFRTTVLKVDVDAYQFEENTASTLYVAHQEQTFTFPLGNEKLMLGDYLADDGIHHVRKQIVLDGTETYLKGTEYSNSYGFVCTSFKDIINASNYTNVLCNVLRASVDNEANTIRLVAANNNIAIAFDKNFVSHDVSSLTTKIAQLYNNGTPIVLEIPLAEETITPYTSAQQTVYNQIKQALSYEEQTNVSGTSDGSNPIFNVEAYQNTKLVLQDISNAIVALGGV